MSGKFRLEKRMEDILDFELPRTMRTSCYMTVELS